MLMMIIWIISICICNCHGKISSKIYGGRPVAVKSVHPYLVSIQYLENHYCGGSIISKNMILTVASCLVLETSPMVFPANIKVVITDGTSDIYDEYNNNMIYSVSYFLIHHEFKPQDSWRNDVALLKLEKSISYYTDRMKVYLPTSWVHRATAMSVIGWHNTKNLNIILMVVQSTKKCEQIFQSFNFRHDEQKCALAEYDHTGISEGDSGNPLFQGRTIVGLVSLYLPDKPNSVILTDVYTQVHWIKSTIIRLRILLRK